MTQTRRKVATDSPFRDVLQSAEDQLWTAFKRTKALQHGGLKGTGRENAVEEFLRDQLPRRFGVARGEAFDVRQHRSAQLDLVVYDQTTVKPLQIGTDNALFPAEALLAVIEVKSVLTRAELSKAMVGAGNVSSLRPYDREFIVGRTGGIDASDRKPRCLFTIFAFETDLASQAWPANEWTRMGQVALEEKVSEDNVSRVLILDRGVIIPPSATARRSEPAEAAKGILREWFLHLTNFLAREVARREPLEWQLYEGTQPRRGWVKLDGYKPPTPSTPVGTPSQPSRGKQQKRVPPWRRKLPPAARASVQSQAAGQMRSRPTSRGGSRAVGGPAQPKGDPAR